jgi:hypothetical protein
MGGIIMEKQRFYFTFGDGHMYSGCCQPIMADDYYSARARMMKEYGNKWAFQYTEEQWNGMKNNPHRHYRIEEELPTILVE